MPQQFGLSHSHCFEQIRLPYLIWFERGDLGLPKDTKNFNFLLNNCSLSQVQNTSFQHAFLVCWGLAASLNIWDCHSATCWCRSGHHMANEREHPQLSYWVWKVDFHRQVAGIRRSYLFKYSSLVQGYPPCKDCVHPGQKLSLQEGFWQLSLQEGYW